MADWTSSERLQPSLLDRLTDQERQMKTEAINMRVLNREQLRRAVLRDLEWLLNANRAEPSSSHPSIVRADYLEAQAELWLKVPYARKSVINYGLPSLSGSNVGRLNMQAIAFEVKKSILYFEPRIDAETLVVKAHLNDGAMSHHNQIKIVISGQMWNQPVPLELLLSVSMDMENGQASIGDFKE